jgi:predicted aspartyl protease
MNKWLILVLAFLICDPRAIWGQEFEFKSNRKKDVIGFKLVKNLIIIPIYINNKGPFNFILDTGVGPMVVTDPSILDSVDMNDARTVKLSGLGKGNEVEAYVTNALTVVVGKASMQHIPAAVLKQDIFNLSNFVGVHIHGLIGYYVFNSFLVKIKYSARKVILYKPGEPVKIKGEPVDITMHLNKPYIQVTLTTPATGTIDAKLLIDSGASNSLSLESYQKGSFPQPKLRIPANLGMGFSGLISGNIGRVASIRIGSFELKDVIAGYPDFVEVAAKALETGRNGSMGADLLRHFDITFDYRNLKMYLKPNNHFKAPFEHDMSGLEVYIEEGKSNRYYVERIEPGSPGIAAGFVPGDEILSVDFIPVRSLDLEDVANMLMAGDGKTIIIEIAREQKSVFKVLTLKKRI